MEPKRITLSTDTAQGPTGKLSLVWTDPNGQSIVVDCTPTEAEMRLMTTRDFDNLYTLPMLSAIQHTYRQ